MGSSRSRTTKALPVEAEADEMAAAEDDPKEYRWETGYEKTWEAITEDTDGLMESSVQELILRARRERLAKRGTAGRTRLGMMRHLYLVVDMSENMAMQDLRPTRLRCALKIVEQFVEEFFYLNPIGQLGLITTRDKRAEIVSELAGNPKKHLLCVRRMMEEGIGNCRGEPSLQNSLNTSLQTLRHKPGHASREVVIIMGSLTTCDPGDIDESIKACKTSGVRCSVICLAAEVRIYKHLAKETGGEFGVILDDSHFKDLLQSHLEPPPSSASAEASLIKMGFPCHSGHQSADHSGSVDQSRSGLGMCLCHQDLQDQGAEAGSRLSVSGFLCPQCNAKYCELPVECRICGLMLVSAPHLARSYHHLFPLPSFKEVLVTELRQDPSVIMTSCFSCVSQFSESSEAKCFRCPLCSRHFCGECDLYVHETLHSCPGCSSSRAMQQRALENGSGQTIAMS